MLAGGVNAAEDRYELVSGEVSGAVAAVKLEALADPSMVGGGPGRASNGNIGLSRIRVYEKTAGGEEREVKLVKAVADFEQDSGGLSVASALDDNPKTGWAVDPQFGKDHAAVFTLGEPLPAGARRMRVVLEFQLNGQHNMGRVRVSVSGQPGAGLGGEANPAEVAALLEKAKVAAWRKAMSEAERGQLFAWWKGRDAESVGLAAKVAAHEAAPPRHTEKVLVCGEGFPPLRMHTQGADFFNETYYLKRGNTELKDGTAAQGFLKVLTPVGVPASRWVQPVPAGSKFSGRRRALAAWLTDTEQGAGHLAARVAVNRVWQHHFGKGIVASPNDFGKTGNLPTHPELLDWLAGELIRGGWRLKPLHKLLMTSAAWRQTGVRDAARETADPDNATFTRFVPRRLEAEALRDSLLAVSGVLDPTMYGAGTRDENSRRRSIYFTVKRSQLIGSMVAFDQPEPLASQGLRPVTTVAPQALMLMNSPQARAWAGEFTERLRKEAPGGLEAQIRRGYLVALGRVPGDAEVAQCRAFAEAAGEGGLVELCQVLLSLNGTAYIE